MKCTNVSLKKIILGSVHSLSTSSAMLLAMLRLERASMTADVRLGLFCNRDLQRDARAYTQRIKTILRALSFNQARLAQSVEHGTLNPRVVGSSPTSGDRLFFFFFFFLSLS